MLRTINAAVRGELLKGQVQKVIRANSASRTLSSSSHGASGTSRCTRRICSINGQPMLLTTTVPLRTTLTPHRQQYRLYSSNFPPHTRVTLPALSPTMEEGTVVSWAKKEGDKLSEGDLLAEIETDKATMAMETPEEGYLAKILIPAGSKGVPIGKLVCIIVEKEADVAKFKDYKDDTPTPVAEGVPKQAPKDAPREVPPVHPPVQQSKPQPQPGQERVSADAGRVYASPMARHLAEQRQIRLEGKGTGLYGSITSKDLDNMLGSPGPVGSPHPTSKHPPAPRPQPSGAAYVDIPLTNMRAIIAKRLLQSKQNVPHYYLTSEINMDRIVALRKRVNERIGEKNKIHFTSVNDYVLKAVAAACQRVPEVNSSWMDTMIRQYSNVDISVAVSTDKGLLTPIIFNAHALGVQAISHQMKDLAAKARAGKLQPHEFQGGTISVSNLGMFGVTHFCAIINPPQAAILAVGASMKRDDKHVMNVTLSADHRVVDGAVGARWLKVLRECLEDPESMIL